MEASSHRIINSPKQIEDFLRLPVSINLATSKDKRFPSLTRGLACRFEASNLELCLYVSEPSARKLLNDIRTHPKLAAVFSLPSTEQTIQLKCNVESVRPINAEELQLIDVARIGFTDEVASFGFNDDFIRHFLHAENCMAIIAKAVEFYDQTPGPLAGSRLKYQP
ncbi:MAG: hypothetical protein ACU836_14445 [Gammaproteobacteria bacterium]